MNHTPLSHLSREVPPGLRHDTTPTISGRVLGPRFPSCDTVASLAQHLACLAASPKPGPWAESPHKGQGHGKQSSDQSKHSTLTPNDSYGSEPPPSRLSSSLCALLRRHVTASPPQNHLREKSRPLPDVIRSPIRFPNHAIAVTFFTDPGCASRRRRFGPGGSCAAAAVAAAVPSKY